MARPRQTTNVLELRGSFDKNPARRAAREKEPEPEGNIGAPFAHMSEGAKECWIEIVSTSHKGVLCASDRLLLEYASRVLDEMRNSLMIDPKMGIRLEQILARLGMTPADRSRVAGTGGKKPANPYGEF